MKHSGTNSQPFVPELARAPEFTSGSMLDVEFAEISDPGVARDHNEDFLGHVEPTSAQLGSLGWLFALADGVGGHDRGEVASRLAVESLLADFAAAHGNEPQGDLLTRMIQSANTKVFETGMATRMGQRAMATTLVACAIRHNRAVIAHVGDSRCYLIRQGQATILTRDHTVANEQLGMGLLSPTEAAKAQTRHILSRSIGHELFVNVDICDRQVMPGDVLLLCSDGLHNPVQPEDIVGAVSEYPELKVAARKLITIANERDGSDNVSVQLIRIKNVEAVGMYRGRPYRLR